MKIVFFLRGKRRFSEGGEGSSLLAFQGIQIVLDAMKGRAEQLGFAS